MTAINILLLGIIAILATALIVSLATRPNVVEVSDFPPKGGSKVMKLQNELAPYVYEKDGKICIKVVKE